jgi:hypothetical protein
MTGPESTKLPRSVSIWARPNVAGREAANGAAEPQGGTTMDLPQAQETLMVTPTTRPWRARALAVIAAVLAALAVWLVTDPLLGVDLAAPTRPGSEELQSITPALVAGTSLVAALAGWGLLALLDRFSARPRTIWTAIAVLVGLLSLAGPLSTIASTTVANGLSLALMHLAVAGVLIPGLAAAAPSLARPAPAREQ